VTGNMRAMWRLRVAAERAKRVLSSTLETPVELDALQDGVDFFMNLPRSKLEDCSRALFEKVRDAASFSPPLAAARAATELIPLLGAVTVL